MTQRSVSREVRTSDPSILGLIPGKVRKMANIRNRYNQAPHLTQVRTYAELIKFVRMGPGSTDKIQLILQRGQGKAQIVSCKLRVEVQVLNLMFNKHYIITYSY